MSNLPDNAFAELLKPGSDYEIKEIEIAGVTQTVFANAPKTMHDVYRDASVKFGDKDFLVYEDQRWTFKQAYDQSIKLASQLTNEYGITKGDRVAVACRNYPELVFSLMAIHGLGAVSVLMNAWWTGPELEYGLEDCGARVFIADEERLERAAPHLKKLGLGVISIRTDKSFDLDLRKIENLIATDKSTIMPPVDMESDDTALIMYTSGTTGHPKGAYSSHRNIIGTLLSFEVTAYAKARGAPKKPKSTTSDKKPSKPKVRLQSSTLIAVPLFHVTGLIVQLFLSYRVARKVSLIYKWDPEVAIDIIEKEKVTAFTGVPTMSRELIEHPSWNLRDTSSLKDMATGGAPRPAEQVKQFTKKATHIRPGQGYGLTETCGLGASISAEDYITRPTSVGKPSYPLVTMKIVDEAGQSLPTGERGEICIKSSTIIQGYWNKPEATKKEFKDGWFFSGDIGYLDEEGYLFIVDRAKEIIIRGGENISCSEVESAIYEHPNVIEACVFGVPHDRLGESVATMIYSQPDSSLTSDEIREHLVSRLAKFKVPEHIWFTKDQLIRGATGKIQKRDIKAKAIEKHLSS